MISISSLDLNCLGLTIIQNKSLESKVYLGLFCLQLLLGFLIKYKRYDYHSLLHTTGREPDQILTYEI